MLEMEDNQEGLPLVRARDGTRLARKGTQHSIQDTVSAQETEVIVHSLAIS